MSEYTKNGQKLGWGPDVAVLNPEKTKFLREWARGRCLDLGCGSGIYTNYLHSLGLEVTGVDNEKEFVSKAMTKYPNIKFIFSTATKLPFENNEFDTVILFDILEHLDEKELLSEARRVGRTLLISVPHTNQKILTRYSLVHSHYLDKTHLRTYTPRTLSKTLKSFKFKVKSCFSSLPISLSGLFISCVARNSRAKELLLKIVLKPFLPEEPIYSTVFAVASKEVKSGS